MDKYLIDLIERMNDTSDHKMESGYKSTETVSWKALREAEKIDNGEFVQQLIDFIDKEKNKKNRDRAYFILGHLAKNTNDYSATQFLIHRVDKETDKYILASLLDRIAYLDKQRGTDLNPIFKATKNNKWLVRYSAIQALKNTNDENAEKSLIDILDQSKDPSDLTYSNSTLNRIGTTKAVPHIEKHLSSRKRDVKTSAKLAIEEIRKRNGNE
ncbi:hypothetical protein Q4534_22330 [Cyclobacterium sp. 1_MG-2023]|uniref:HEAT repeat domain-containing protein n=1 Tax=Cyclobacterium sp. 1_MG-2023 TaxID=3062681 RepID=UPI0026E1C27C|nr:hypothetical protein [Cyclobacterium sp. 1_MG-2023]MDO6440182.1 hypothetical protein [Cyclobacterium sp. 1_MG-2023]